MKMKAQVSIDFIILLSIAVGILTFSIYSYYTNTIQVQSSSRYIQASAICQQIRNAVTNAVANGNGFKSSFVLPANLNGQTYTTTVFGAARFVEISFGNQVAICNLASRNVTDSAGGTTFQLTPKSWTVTNVNRRVIIN